MCNNKGAEKNKGGRSKEGGAEGGERGLEDTTQIHITGTAVSTTRVGCAEHSLRSFLKEAIIIINVLMGCEGRAP